MKFGYFDDDRREYVIQTPDTPLPWINYLGSRDFFSLISNTCGGYSFYRDAKLLRLTRYRYNNIPADSNGKYYYIRDGEEIWNPGFMPARTPLDFYECRHGLGYSVFTGRKNELQAELLAFVPVDSPCEINRLRLTNTGSAAKTLTLFSYVEFCLWNAVDDASNFQRNLSIGEVEVGEGGSVIYHKSEYRERRNHYAFFSVNSPVDGFDTSRDAFLGQGRGNNAPEAVLLGSCKNSVASGWYPAACQQLDLTLAAGEEKELIFILGYCENPRDRKFIAPNVIRKDGADEIREKYDSPAKVRAAFAALQDEWEALLSRYNVFCGSDHVSRMVNTWNPYQCMITFNMSRSASYYESGTGRGMGFRDSCQDLLGFVHLVPDRARARILDIAATQFPDGSAYHQYQPLTRKGNSDIGSGFNDDPLWLIAAAAAYVKETGEIDILKEPVPFDNTPGSEASLFEHLRRSFTFTLTHLGPHGLPLIGRADWNDCLNLNCFSAEPGESFQTTGPSEGPVAESVFIAALFVRYGRDYARLASLIGLKEEAQAALKSVAEMEKAVLENGWDGEWFLRAYDANSEKVGSRECEEGKIYIEPQGFCVYAGIGVKEGLAEKALDSVARRLDSRYGIMILQPSYTSYHLNLGEISSYPPGYKENGGIFCHNNPWISIAETVIGRGGRAFELYKKICPSFIEDLSEIHRTEPYCYSQMIAGKDAPRFGEAKNSWLTGTAAWAFVSISQAILGIRPDYDGLIVDPCIPGDFGSFKVRRTFRGTVYEIEVVQNGSCEKGITRLLVDGRAVPGNKIPVESGKKKVSVRAELG